MDWNIRKNLRYLLLIFGFCGLVPHVMLLILQSAAPSDFWSPAKLENWSHFFVREWLPFWAVFLIFLRLQKMDDFSLLPVLEMALIVLSLLPRYDADGIWLTLPLMLVMECFGLLKKLEASENRLLAGMAQNRGMLRACFFWSVAVICVMHIASAGINARILPFFLLPVPAALLYSVFHQLKDRKPTLGGILGMLLMVPVSLLLASVGAMEFYKSYHLPILAVGYGLVFLVLMVYHTERKPA